MRVEQNSKSVRSIGGAVAIVVSVMVLGSACGGGDDSGAGPGTGSDASTSDVVVTNDAAASDGAPQPDASAPTCVVDAATKTCGIDATHATIQSAVDDTACDRLCVPAGEFSEALTIRRAFEIVGSGTAATILSPGGGTVDAGGLGGVITIVGGPVVLRDLSVKNGTAVQGGCINASAPLELDTVNVSGCVGLAQGGGIYQNGGSLTLENGSDVTGNAITATPSTTGFFGGGGIYATGGAIVSVHGSTIEKNLVSVDGSFGGQAAGGGLLAYGAFVTLDGATIRQNTTEGTTSGSTLSAWGGGVACVTPGSVSVLGGTLFESNKADASQPMVTDRALGGGMAAEQCSLVIADATFHANTATAVQSSGTLGSSSNAQGGAVYVASANVTADVVSFTGNSAEAQAGSATSGGGAVSFVDVSATFTDCTFDGNTTKSKGSVAGGSAVASGALTLTAAVASQSVTIRRSTISDNTASADAPDATTLRVVFGGGICNGLTSNRDSTLILVSSTVSGNTASALGASGSATAKGGGIDNAAFAAAATTELFSSTIAANTATGLTAQGGGIASEESGGGTPIVDSTGSIVAGNTATTGPDCDTISGAFTSAGYDWIGVTTGCTLAGAQTGNHNGDPKLSPLADNGGATKTHALASGSGAINAGRPAGATSDSAGVLTTDQRALPRPTGASGTSLPDIGAFEVQ